MSSKTETLYLLNAYKEPLAQVEATLHAMERVQPSPCPTMLVYDGTKPENGRKLAPVTIFRQENAKVGHEKAGYWLHEIFRLFLLTKRTVLVKFDPDTNWLRRLNLDVVFDVPGCYGRIVQGVKGYPYVHGGCMAMHAECAQKLVDSGELLKFSRMEGLSSDQMLGKACLELGVNLYTLPGVGITGDLHASVTHD